MKKLILAYLLWPLFCGAQEMISYNIQGQTIEFAVSQTEIYVEHEIEEKARFQDIVNGKNIPVLDNSTIMVMDKSRSFYTQKQKLISDTQTDFSKVEPVLVYSDGTRQITKGELNIMVREEGNLSDILMGITYKFEVNEFQKDLYHIKTNLSTPQLFQLVNSLNQNSSVVFAEPNFIRLLKPYTNDPEFDSQWSINNQGYLGGTVDADMDVEEAWDYSTGAGITVAIIDEGVDLTHPDLTANLLMGFDATGNGSNGAPNEDNDDAHDTACAGIVGAIADNTIGIAGVAYDTNILPVRIAFSNGLPLGDPNRRWVTNDTWVANGINWAWQNGADILSNSWGGGNPSATITSAINNAVNNGRNNGTVNLGSIVLFSSGNDNDAVAYPANLPNVIAVGAISMCNERKRSTSNGALLVGSTVQSDPENTSCDGEWWWGSNFGNEIDVVAPGVEIWTTDISGANGYTNDDLEPDFNGTSSACPNVAGVAALILSVNPNLTGQEARDIIESTAQKVGGYNYARTRGRANGTWNNEMGYGLVNALAAIQ